MKLNRAKELPGYWNSDIYSAKSLEQSLDVLALVSKHFPKQFLGSTWNLAKLQAQQGVCI